MTDSEIYALVKKTPGITNMKIAAHYGFCNQTVRTHMVTRIDLSAVGIFAQMYKGVKMYFTQEYADKHGLEAEVRGSSRKCIWTIENNKEAEKYVSDIRRFDKMMKVTKVIT